MAIEALENSLRASSEVKSSKVLRLDYVALGKEVLTYVAIKNGLTYEEVIGKGRKNLTQRSQIQTEFLGLVPQVLTLTRDELAAVIHRTPDVVSECRRALNGLKPYKRFGED